MTHPVQPDRIQRIRGEILVALKMLYPAAIQAERLFRSLLAVFPQLEPEHFRKDLAYLADKGYITRIRADHRRDPDLAGWRRQYLRLTAAGVEVADACIQDPAIET